jgi:hypothetical protein
VIRSSGRFHPFDYFSSVPPNSRTHIVLIEKIKNLVFTIALGLASDMTKLEAQEMLEYQIVRQTGRHHQEQIPIDGTVPFGWFVRKRFFPLKEAMWRPETAKVRHCERRDGSDLGCESSRALPPGGADVSSHSLWPLLRDPQGSDLAAAPEITETIGRPTYPAR